MLLTLDLSLNEPGYCIETPHGVDSGFWKPPKGYSPYAKIEYNLQVILKLCKEFKIKLVGIESASFRSKSASTNILAEQQGVIKYELKKLGIDITEIPITRIKKYITGKGNAKKIDVINALRENHNILKTNDNECDAIAAYLYLKSLDAVATVE